MDCEQNPNDPVCIAFYGGPSPSSQITTSTMIPQLYMGPPATTAAAAAATAVATPWYYKFGMSPKLWGLTALGLIGAGLLYKKYSKK